MHLNIPKLCGFAILSLAGPLMCAQAKPKAIIAYVFVKDGVLQAGQVDPLKVTRVNYAFANLANGEIVEGFPHDAENFAFLNGLKARNPHLEVLVSVGGWTWSGGFSDMALTAASRQRFIDSAVRFIQKYSLDGLDIDWEYPGLPGIGNPFRPEDAHNYSALVEELRARFKAESKHRKHPLLISVAVGASSEFLANTHMDEVARAVDTVNLMAYDYYESSSSATAAHHAPLFSNPTDAKGVSVDASVRAYLAAGVPPSKLVLGVPFYGHAWSDVGDPSHGLFQPGKPATVDARYRNIASLLASGYVNYWDPVSSAPYLYNPDTRTFISYENMQSVALKGKYVLEHHLGGIMFWEYSADNGELLDAVNRSLKSAQ